MNFEDLFIFFILKLNYLNFFKNIFDIFIKFYYSIKLFKNSL